jgi:CRISPR-associated protein Cas1
VRDSCSYLYVEHCRIEQDAKAIAFHDASGKVPVPCASLMLLMLGPGTTITHAAIRALAECGCLIVWVGEQGVRLYAQGLGETRSSSRLLKQARCWADDTLHLKVVRRLYQLRFSERLAPGLTLQQIRGLEGVRVRDAYAAASRRTGVPWSGRHYRRADWHNTDAVNRALSVANSCLYGVCHAAILAAGWSPALGFIHTGKALSFVYDIADIYKTETTVPVAFETVAQGDDGVETRVRRSLRDRFAAVRLLPRIVEEVAGLFDDSGTGDTSFDSDAGMPGGLWEPGSAAPGGRNWADVLLSTEGEEPDDGRNGP